MSGRPYAELGYHSWKDEELSPDMAEAVYGRRVKREHGVGAIADYMEGRAKSGHESVQGVQREQRQRQPEGAPVVGTDMGKGHQDGGQEGTTGGGTSRGRGGPVRSERAEGAPPPLGLKREAMARYVAASVAANVRAWLNEHHETHQGLADRCGIPRVTITRLLQGKAQGQEGGPRLGTAVALALAMGMTLDELCGIGRVRERL